MPLTVPATSERNWTPSSTGEPSWVTVLQGLVEAFHRPEGLSAGGVVGGGVLSEMSSKDEDSPFMVLWTASASALPPISTGEPEARRVAPVSISSQLAGSS